MSFNTKNYLVVLAFSFLAFTSVSGQSLCENGVAAGQYPCENVDLLAVMNTAQLGGGLGVGYNDIWGWTDPLDGKEYVMIGRTDGTSFVDISNPTQPVFLGRLPTHTTNSIWRDIKVNGNYAFIVSEATGHGMQVFDLTRLRNVVNPPVVFTSDAHYGSFGRAHNIVINEGVARAYAVGSNTFSGGLHIVNISNPLAPVIMGDFAADGYTHDAQVVTYAGPDATHQGKQIAFCSNENTLTIVDVEDPLDCTQLSRVGYANVAYAHQGWLTEDHRYFLMDDELDESNQGINTRTIVWDVQDLDNPVVIGQYFGPTQAIDHNLYTRGNLVYESNYRAGLRILDSGNIASGTLSEVASFDVYPGSNSAQFNGSWSNYPYFASGVVAVSHIEVGLFLLRPSLFRATNDGEPVCSNTNAAIDLAVLNGFQGPVNFSVTAGLPVGSTATFSANGVGVGNYTLTLSNLPNANTTANIEITATGSSYTYTATVAVEILDCGNIVFGCTNPQATNFDPAATVDDGSCIVPCTAVAFTLVTDCWGEEVSWTLIDGNSMTIASVPGNTYGDLTTNTWNGCLTAGCYNMVIGDSFGNGLFGTNSGCSADGNYFMTDDQGNTLFQMATPAYGPGITESFCITAPDCLGDFDNDGLRTVIDFLVILGDFGCSANCASDITGDGFVTSADVVAFLAIFGTPCP